MFSDTAVRVSGLSKLYQMYDKPQDRLKQSIYSKLINLFGLKPINFFKEFWALKDISFEIKKGETVGIIGRNGSGKSTLLQMICGILNPTSGEVSVNGRIAALLELGSGFNPEFTGRENIYMNGSLLGLTRQELDERFEAIVTFADIGHFIEQPVKIYSSGMFVRLAFAVIAHVDADILIIDEALAVGDAVFNQKCMRFLRKFKETGTLIFVSHDTSSVVNLCKKALWLDHGQIRQFGPSNKVSENYLEFTLQEVYGDQMKLQSNNAINDSDISSHGDSRLALAADAAELSAAFIDYGSSLSVQNHLDAANGWKTGAGEILSVNIENLSRSSSDIFRGGERICLSIKARIYKDFESPILGFLVRDRLGQDLFGENTLQYTKSNPIHIAAGAVVVGVFIFKLPMLPNGRYTVMTSLANGDLFNNIQHHWLHDALILNVSSSSVRYGLVGLNFEAVELKLST